MSRSEQISVEDIWNLTSGGEDIFQRELGKLSFTSNMSAPWRKDEIPSLRLKRKNNKVYYTDYGGDQSKGSALDFLQKYYNIDFPQAIEKVKEDFKLKKPKEYVKIFNKSKVLEVDPVIYEFNDMPFTKEHHKYFNPYELSEDFLNKEGDIYAIKKWAINKKIQILTESEIAFGFVYRDLNGDDTGLRKILRIGPNVNKKDKWRTNVSNTKIWYLYKYIRKDIKQLFIAKSNKDALCTMKLGIPSCATQSENDIILKQNIPMLREICSNLVLNFGSDPQGAQASINVSKEFNIPWFNTPKRYLKDGINDNAEYVKEFGGECLKQLLINKKYICQGDLK